MSKTLALKIIFGIAIAGVLFSGYCFGSDQSHSSLPCAVEGLCQRGIRFEPDQAGDRAPGRQPGHCPPGRRGSL